MTHNRASIPVHTTIDIFKLFNRRELFAVSTVCHRYNAIINKKFPNAPYLVFEELLYCDRWEWIPIEGSDFINDMPTHLVALLKESKFVRFKYSDFQSNEQTRAMNKPLIDEITPVKHIFEGQTLGIGNGTLGYLTVTADLVQKCRCLLFSGMKLIDFSIILPQILANDHDKIGLHVLPMGTNQLTVPVTNAVDFLFRRTSNGSKKKLRISSDTLLDPENSVAIVKAIKEKFLASTGPFRFKFTLFSYDDDDAEDEMSECKNEIGQSLKIILFGNSVQCQVE